MSTKPLIACTRRGWVYIMGCKRKRNTLRRSLKINQIYLKIVTQGFLASLIADLQSDFKNFKWRIQYGGQVNLINFHKPQPPRVQCKVNY